MTSVAGTWPTSRRRRAATRRRRPQDRAAPPRRHHHGRQPTLGARARRARGAGPRRRRRGDPAHRGARRRSAASRCSPSTPSAARTGSAPATRCETLFALLDAAIRDETPRPRRAGRRGPAAGPPRRSCRGATRASIEEALAAHRRRHPHDAQRRLQLLRRARRSWMPCGACVDGRQQPGRRSTRTAIGAPVHRGPARPGPAHPHRRRPAHQQLPAVAGGLRRALLLRPLLAGLRPGRPRRGARGVRPPRRVASAARGPAVVRERHLSAVVMVPVVVVVFLLGQPWLTLGIALLALLAAGSEVFRLLPPAGFPVRRSCPGVVFAAARRAGLGWLAPERRWAAAFVARRRWSSRPSTPSVAPDVRDGFLAWMGGTLRGPLRVAAGVRGRHPRHRAGGAPTTPCWAAASSAGAGLAAGARADGLALRHLRLPRPGGPSSGAASSTTSRPTRPGAASSAARSRPSSWRGLLTLGRPVAPVGGLLLGFLDRRRRPRPATWPSRCSSAPPAPRTRARSSPATAASSTASTRSCSRRPSSSATWSSSGA